MIKVEGLHKSFDGREVLKDVSMTFDTGKVNLVIGKSGSGKTVLLKTVIGLESIDRGSILYGDRDITKMNSGRLKQLRNEIGILFQGGALFDSLSVIDNVRFPLDIFSKNTPEENHERAVFCLRRVNLDTEADRLFPSEISGGMKKRVAIARAIVLQPHFLFCDEPNSGLDPLTSGVIDRLIMDITHEYHMTTVVNTHDMNSVFNIGEKIFFIDEGKKEWEGSKEELFNVKNEKVHNFLFTSKLMEKIGRDL